MCELEVADAQQQLLCETRERCALLCVPVRSFDYQCALS